MEEILKKGESKNYWYQVIKKDNEYGVRVFVADPDLFDEETIYEDFDEYEEVDIDFLEDIAIDWILKNGESFGKD